MRALTMALIGCQLRDLKPYLDDDGVIKFPDADLGEITVIDIGLAYDQIIYNCNGQQDYRDYQIDALCMAVRLRAKELKEGAQQCGGLV